MSGTYSRTASASSSYDRILKVTRKVQADFLAILDTYRCFSETYASSLIADVRVLLDEEVVDRVKFTWLRPGTAWVLHELEYRVVVGAGLADHASGGIPYRAELTSADFHVRVVYNDRWVSMSRPERARVSERLELQWGPSGDWDYSTGLWVVDRTYSNEGFGLERRRFSI